jgi:hypothetical protein
MKQGARKSIRGLIVRSIVLYVPVGLCADARACGNAIAQNHQDGKVYE